jgi:septum formation inhibitor MinC
MTDEQIKQSMAQIEQDNINLDYSKWSFEQRRANLPNDHNLWQQVRDRTLARQKSDNAEAGRKYRATLEAAKAEKQREYDAEIDRELEPQKQRLMREWLANNPNFTATDFEKKAWHLLKANLIEQRTARIFENDIRQMQETGRYSL